MFSVSRQRRLPLTIALLVGLIVIIALLPRTHGGTPAGGSTYTGTVVVRTRAGVIVQRLGISFVINAAGTRVGTFRFPGGLPSGCRARQATELAPAAASVPIVSPGRFGARLTIRAGALPAAIIGTLEISGSFDNFGRESGAVATIFSPAALRHCAANGVYTARS